MNRMCFCAFQREVESLYFLKSLLLNSAIDIIMKNCPNFASSFVVVSPLVSLMRSQVTHLKTLGLKAAYLSDVTGHREESEDIV